MFELLTPDPAALSSLNAFQDLPAEVLAWLLQEGELRHYASGEIIVNTGDPAELMIGVVQGAMQFYGKTNGQREPVFRMEAGQITGVLPYSRLQIIQGQGIAVGDTVLYTLHRSKFPALEHISPELVQRLVGIMSDRVREQVRTQERDDKLRALGKLSAGLSHELNNPPPLAGPQLRSIPRCKPSLRCFATCLPPARPPRP
jgi:CRP-like cAMP-binding protein